MFHEHHSAPHKCISGHYFNVLDLVHQICSQVPNLALWKKSAKLLMIGDVYGEKRKNKPSYKWSTYNQLLNKEVIIQK
jgi:hypothetical protein